MSAADAGSLQVSAPNTDEVAVVTSDASLLDVHFPASTRDEDVAYKALAVNLSDLAAMGARPLALDVRVHGPEQAANWCEAIARHVGDQLGEFAIPGRIARATTRAQGLAVLALGAVERTHALRRDGARPGDEVWVSGTLGDAGAGLAIALDAHAYAHLDATRRAALRARLDRPTARLALGRALRGVASACIDVSDGLCGDLGHVMRASGAAAELRLDTLPTSSALRDAAGADGAHRLALAAGDDYELCFTAPAARRAQVLEAAHRAEASVTRVGHVSAGHGVRLRDGAGCEVGPPRSYQHRWRA